MKASDPATGLLHPNEDFFQDIPFAQLIAHHVQLSRNPNAVEYYQKAWRLVVNGDMFDFLQVVSLPPEGDVLAAVTGKRRHTDLSANEQLYGLGTEERAIVWKLETIAAGHPLFFQALAWFLAQPGNELILMKGNHDVELAWEGAQTRLLSLLVEAYAAWATAVPHAPEHPLPHLTDMPAALALDTLADQVRFPKQFLYQRDLFYIEHGCQYDPVNFFQDFADPRLIDENGQVQEVIELPEGSLFVRYFFNAIEAVHPFADNFKPITRYFFWLLTNAPGQLMTFGKVMLQYREARKLVNRKVKKKVRYQQVVDGRTTPHPFLSPLQDIQEKIRATMTTNSKQTTRRMIGSIVLAFLAIFLLGVTVRAIAVGEYGLMVAALFFTAVCLVASIGLFQSLNHLLAEPYLFTAAQEVAGLVNGRPTPHIGPVRYFIFGHDHAARLMLLPPLANPHQPDYRQWYINTGSWIPVFSQEEQLARPAANLTFLRLVPSRLQTGHDVPELLRWSEDANAPRPVRIFR
ncbi:MAG: hypothetical protein HC804_09850 [Anaerolineae bacterium]|nr:hypothetical protein [Anaerolineae bacterium]